MRNYIKKPASQHLKKGRTHNNRHRSFYLAFLVTSLCYSTQWIKKARNSGITSISKNKHVKAIIVLSEHPQGHEFNNKGFCRACGLVESRYGKLDIAHLMSIGLIQGTCRKTFFTLTAAGRQEGKRLQAFASEFLYGIERAAHSMKEPNQAALFGAASHWIEHKYIIK